MITRVPLMETIAAQRKPLLSEMADGGHLWLKGTFIEGDIKNHNGRIYPLTEIERAIRTLNEKIQIQGGVLGELDHPDGLNINMPKISHAITEMGLSGMNGIGKLRVLDNPNGHIVRSVVEAGVQLGVSRRGSGRVGNDGRVSDFEIVTIDIVANPSAPNAYPKAIIERMMSSMYGQEAYRMARVLKEDRAAQKYFASAMKQFLTEIRDELSWRQR